MRTVVAVLVAFTAAAPSPSLADVVHLTDGGELRGSARREGDEVVVRVDGGEVRVLASEVARIEDADHALETLSLMRLRFGDSIERRAEAAQFATEQGLHAEAQGIWQEVLHRDPSHVEAHEALGHVLVDGVWLTEEANHRRQGLVLFGGRWMRPDEAAGARAEVARLAEQRREEAAARAAERRAVHQAQPPEAPKTEERSDDGRLGPSWPWWWVVGPGLPVFAAPVGPVAPAPPPAPTVRPPLQRPHQRRPPVAPSRAPTPPSRRSSSVGKKSG